jgi:PPOX class probable F420-dependent enzyme
MTERDTPEAFLREPNLAVISTVGPGGRPHALPIWYVYEDGAIIMITGRGSQKHRNIERNPEVAVTVDRRTLPYYAVMVQGKAEIGAQPSDELRLTIAERYLGEELGRRYVASGSGAGTVTIRLRPRRFVEYHGVSGKQKDEG